MNTAVISASAASCHQPRALPPLSLTRFVIFVTVRWERWRERSAERCALEALSRLDATTLRDLGLEEGYSRATALRAAREQYDAGASLSGRLGTW